EPPGEARRPVAAARAVAAVADVRGQPRFRPVAAQGDAPPGAVLLPQPPGRGSDPAEGDALNSAELRSHTRCRPGGLAGDEADAPVLRQHAAVRLVALAGDGPGGAERRLLPPGDRPGAAQRDASATFLVGRFGGVRPVAVERDAAQGNLL